MLYIVNIMPVINRSYNENAQKKNSLGSNSAL